MVLNSGLLSGLLRITGDNLYMMGSGIWQVYGGTHFPINGIYSMTLNQN